MNNVYQKIELFYEKNTEAADILERALLEKYFRRLSWQGKGKNVIKAEWLFLQGLLNYMLLERLDDFNSLYKFDFIQIFKMVVADSKFLQADEENLQKFFGCLDDFFHFIADKAGLSEKVFQACITAKELFFDDGEFKVPVITEDDLSYDISGFMDEGEEDFFIEPEEADRLNKILEKLMSGVAEYYRGTEYWADLNRAMEIFLGPEEDAPEHDDVSFWLGFWDYFFFDYHLIINDQSPLENFYYKEYDNLLLTERTIIKTLLSAEFKIFSVESVQGDQLTVIDLFTGAHSFMPCPEIMTPDVARNKIIYGHVNVAGAIMMSNITTVTASEKLQQRIKEEIKKSFEFYRKFQAPTADMRVFLNRHAGAVRHIINILASFAQLNIVAFTDDIPKIVPKAGYQEKILPFYRQEILNLATKVGYSAYSAYLIGKLYDDCSALNVFEQNEHNAKEFVTAIFLVFAFANGLDTKPVKQLMKMIAANLPKAEKLSKDMVKMLGCVSGDPRYLTEEGFVHVLYHNLS